MRKKLSSIISIAILMALLLTDVPDLLFDNYLSPVLKFLATRFIYPSTFFNVIDLILGTVFTWFVVLFFFAWLIHRAWINENSRPGIRPADMPILRPIPIPTKNRRFYARLLVWLMEPRRWEVGEHWCYSFENGDETIKLIVPRGFVFDGASIPRLLWFFLSPTGLFLIPGLIHDYGYKYGRMWPCNAEEGISKFPLQPNPGRCYWDNLFFKTGIQVNGLWLLNALAWAAVVCGGFFAWRSHEKTRKAGDSKPEMVKCCSCEGAIGAQEIQNQEKDEVNAEK